MEDCIFCKIVKGEVPCYKVYEDEKVLAFLDINPVSEGHVLVVPKDHYSDIVSIDENILADVVRVAQILLKKMIERGIADGGNLFQANRISGEQTVFHFHMHVIPRNTNDGIDFSKGLMSNIVKMNEEKLKVMCEMLKI